MGEFDTMPVSLDRGKARLRYRWRDGTLHDVKEPDGG